ncbi:TetR family transcriptional regulator [Acrocarpospora corrugata]|uniref:TetR family transcriptional regulator n=1 Tax=Acrocarpospora corrugata TaxID=35763 RepID=A0A5M3WGT1_9ACTN|nr:TetR/AcrR family transcriptional regulator [Acrocarpospora corrugata]GES06333.1 TetR family transcriptional regulator [Acrocarpospora corrugata]
MARSVDPAAHASRREEFLDVAQRLIQTRGYAQMSVQDVLAGTEASKGAFYHYFDSKQALLEALIERTADTLAAHLAPIARLDAPALDRLQRFFAALAGWKVPRRDLLVALLRVWYGDDNAVVRQKMRPGLADRMLPLLNDIISDGAAQGVFTTPYPEQTGRVLLSLLNDLNDTLGELLLTQESQEPGAVSPPPIEAMLAAYTDAMERVLGVPAGSLLLVDPATLTAWFDPTGDRP